MFLDPYVSMALMRVDPYLRKSTADGGKSVGQQDDELTDGIVSEGWEVGRRFTDDNRSASRYARKTRERYEALLVHIASGACQAIGIWEVARGGRRESTYFELLELCRSRGTKIYVHTHGRLYDLTRRADWRVFAQEIVDAADYAAKISENSTRGKRVRARTGLPDGKPLDGYRTVRDGQGKAIGREIDEQRAPIIRRMAREALAGRTSMAIARGLAADGVVRPCGTAFRGVDIGRIVTNPSYAAIRLYRIGRPDEQRFEGAWEPIICREDHERLVAIFRDPGRRTQRGSELKWLLSGLAKCGREGCGAPMRPTRQNGARRYFCLACGRLTVTAEPVDEFVTEVVLERLDPSRHADAGQLFTRPDSGAAAVAAEAELKDLSDRLSSFRAQAVAGKVTAESFSEIEAGLMPLIEAARATARRLSAPPALVELEGVDVHARWHDLSVRLRREVVRHLMTVTILPAARRGQRFNLDRVQIDWR